MTAAFQKGSFFFFLLKVAAENLVTLMLVFPLGLLDKCDKWSEAVVLIWSCGANLETRSDEVKSIIWHLHHHQNYYLVILRFFTFMKDFFYCPPYKVYIEAQPILSNFKLDNRK